MIRKRIKSRLIPICYSVGQYHGFGRTDAEALADLITKVLWQSPYLKV